MICGGYQCLGGVLLPTHMTFTQPPVVVMRDCEDNLQPNVAVGSPTTGWMRAAVMWDQDREYTQNITLDQDEKIIKTEMSSRREQVPPDQ
jgi:hypothetical protein